jgi:hypothetical protein
MIAVRLCAEGLRLYPVHYKEVVMFSVTEKAARIIKDVIEKQQGAQSVRILTQPG